MSVRIDYRQLTKEERRRCIVAEDPIGAYAGFPDAQNAIFEHEQTQRIIEVSIAMATLLSNSSEVHRLIEEEMLEHA